MRRALLAVVGLAFALPSVVAAQPGLPFKLLMLPNPGTPEVFSGDGKTHVAYEFFLANFTDQTIQIDSLAIAGANPNSDEPVTPDQANTVNFEQLKSLFSLIGANPLKPQAPVLKPSEAGVIFLLRDDWNLEKWTNELTVEAQGKPQSRQKVAVDMKLSPIKPVVIQAPLRGKNWWTPNVRPTIRSTGASSSRSQTTSGCRSGLPWIGFSSVRMATASPETNQIIEAIIVTVRRSSPWRTGKS